MKALSTPPLRIVSLVCLLSAGHFAAAQSSPTPSPSLEQRVNDLEKRLNALESIPAVALALKLRVQTNQTAEASPSPQGDAPLELESWSYQFKRGKYEYENRHVFTYSLKNLTEKGIKLVDGSLIFRDRLGEKIMTIKLLQDIHYPFGESRSATGGWSVNSFNPSEERFQTMSHDDVQPELRINKAVFEDNTIWSAEAHQ
jgi:hypothetical protein